MQAIAVIGSCWGDCGKGSAVDKLASSNPNSLVVRHSGGAQSGHTVTLPDGKRHIFSHFCSGALAGAPSHLSEYFVVNPRIFVKERQELVDLGDANLNITVDPKALVTTPLDVAFNRAIETKRGAGRHGSVGIGFGETIERSERGFPIYVEDLVDRDRLRKKIALILIKWAGSRVKELDVTLTKEPYVWDIFYQECKQFSYFIHTMPLKLAASPHQTIIFEGAQGLLLDQKRGMTFPYVTRSNTGLQNVIPLLKQLSLNEIEVIYMMRPYLTRHGAGPLPGEVSELPGIEVIDETNKTGPWQGALRLAPMNVKLIRDTLATDLRDVQGVNVKPYIGISCVDQGKASDIFALSRMGYKIALTGHGPRRDQYKLRRGFNVKRN